MGMIGNFLSGLTQSGTDPQTGVYNPSPLAVLGQMVFGPAGQGIAGAADNLRNLKYEQALRAYQAQAMGDAMTDPSLGRDAKLAMLFNPGKFGEAEASHYTQATVPGGDTLVNGPGGMSVTAPLLGFDPTSGRGFALQGDGSIQASAGLGGGWTTDSGNARAVNSRTGQSYGYPSIQKAEVGTNVGPLAPTPDVTGPPPGGPGVAPVAGAPAQPGAAPQPAAGPATPAGPGPVVPQLGQPAATPARGPAPVMTPQLAFAAASKIAPGATLTSGYRTPAHNAQVGGVPNSLHTRGAGQAIDFTLPQGVTAEQFRAGLQAQGLPVTEFLNEGDHVHWGWGPKGSPTPQPQAQAQALPRPVQRGQGGLPTTLSGGQQRPGTPAEVAQLGLPPGTAIVWNGKGGYDVTKQPEYDAKWDAGQQQDFATNDAVKTYTGTVRPSYQALIGQVGQMNGPAAFAMMDSTIRTFNPDAVTRQQQIEAMHKEFGIPMDVLGTLGRWSGNGSIPLKLQQQIIDGVQKFAAAHYDTANSLYQSKAQLAQRVGRDVRNMTIPLGPRPERYIALPGRAVPESQIRAEAAAAIRANPRQRGAILAKMQGDGINTQGL